MENARENSTVPQSSHRFILTKILWNTFATCQQLPELESISPLLLSPSYLYSLPSNQDYQFRFSPWVCRSASLTAYDHILLSLCYSRCSMHKAEPSEEKLMYDWKKVQKWWRSLLLPSSGQLVVAAVSLKL